MKKNLINILCFISLISLSFVMSNCSEKSYMVNNNYIIPTLIITAIIGIILVLKKVYLNFFQKLNKKSMVFYISVVLVAYLFYKLYRVLSITFSNNIIKEYVNISDEFCFGLRLGILISSLLILWMILYYVLNVIYSFFKEELKFTNKSEKILIAVVLIILVIVNTLWYTNIPLENIKDDILYSTDSFYVINNMFPRFNWALDFRHVLFSILFCPFQFIFDVLKFILPNFSSFYYIYLSVINGTFLLLTAIMLGRITNNKWLSYLYLCSYPTILFSVIIEKYQYCVFFIVLFVYVKTKKEKNAAIENISLISAVGTISTSAVIGIWSNEKKGVDKIKEWIKIGLIFVSICIIFGKLGVLMTLFDYISPRVGLGLIHRFYGLTEMLSSCFFAPLYIIKDNVFIWQNEANYLNVFGLLVFILCIISFILNRKKIFAQISFSWLVFAVVLFIIMNWYCYEAPLFNLYFSWSILGLIYLLIDKLIEKEKYKNKIYFLLCMTMLILNLNQLYDIFNFILKL